MRKNSINKFIFPQEFAKFVMGKKKEEFLLKNKIYFFLISLAILIFDLLTKKWIKTNFKLYESKSILGNFFKFTFIENSGIAFGLFSSTPDSIWKNIAFFVITLSAAALIIYFLLHTEHKLALLAFSFILGGALGNILERIIGNLLYYGTFVYEGKIFFGRVVDFIDIGIGDARWFFFNVADTFISIGIGLLLFYTIFLENKQQKKKE